MKSRCKRSGNKETSFSDKFQTPGNITLLEGDELISDDEKIAKILNDYFVDVTAGWKIAEVEQNLTKTNESCDPVDVAIEMYKIDMYTRHPSIKLIKQKTEAREKFSFQQVSLKEIETQLSELDSTKSITFGSIPEKILAEHSDFFTPNATFLHQ